MPLRVCYNIIRALCYKSFIKGEKIIPRLISDECIMCGACSATCPVSAIAEGDGKYNIDKDQCIDCGACEAGCPVGAISEE